MLVDYDPATGLIDLDDLARQALRRAPRAVYFENPTYLGMIESQAAEIAALARGSGAEPIVGVDPISLGVLAPPADYGADIVVGTMQPLGVHMNCGGGIGGFIASARRGALRARVPDAADQHHRHDDPGERGFGLSLFAADLLRLARRRARTGPATRSTCGRSPTPSTWRCSGPQGFRELGELILQRSHYAAQLARRDARACGSRFPAGFFKEFVVTSTDGRRSREVNAGSARAPASSAARTSRRDFPELGQSALYCVTEVHTKADIDRLAERARGGRRHDAGSARYHAAVWDEPLIMEMGHPGRRGLVFPRPSPRCAMPSATRRTWSRTACGARRRPTLPELSEPEVLRHYLHLSQETLGHDGHQPLRHLHDEVQPAASARRSPRAPSSPSCTRTRTRRRCRACSRSSTAST